jgi:hypothetical protein
MAKKIDVFGKTLKTPRTMLDLSIQPEPFGGEYIYDPILHTAYSTITDRIKVHERKM